jgi:hypothetical protein
VGLEQTWYSAPGGQKHHAGISTFSIGTGIIAEKLESTSVLIPVFPLRRIAQESDGHDFA